MSAKVLLTVKGGSHSGKKFVFSAPTRCVAGRAKDCSVRLTGAFEDCLVSRHHCELEVNPPRIVVRDLGSRNGTFVNGHVIGMRPKGLLPAPPTAERPEGCELKDGDELAVGPVVLQVAVAEADESLAGA